MKGMIRIVAGTVTVLFFAGAAGAQMEMRGPGLEGIWNPVVGYGATYEMQSSRDQGRKSTMWIAVLGKEAVDGKEGYWLETAMDTGAGRGEMVSKVLLVREGDQNRVKRIIVQMPGRPPMEMPASMLQARGSAQNYPVDIRSVSEDLGKETITTPAGTFLCEHFRRKDGRGEAWVAPKAGPYGLVKATSQEHGEFTMILIGIATNAQDKITGSPIPFNPMGMAPPSRP